MVESVEVVVVGHVVRDDLSIHDVALAFLTDFVQGLNGNRVLNQWRACKASSASPNILRHTLLFYYINKIILHHFSVHVVSYLLGGAVCGVVYGNFFSFLSNLISVSLCCQVLCNLPGPAKSAEKVLERGQ